MSSACRNHIDRAADDQGRDRCSHPRTCLYLYSRWIITSDMSGSPAKERYVAKYGIGQPVLRFEDARLLQGRGRYIHDVNLPGQAYAVFLRSQHAHAKII